MSYYGPVLTLTLSYDGGVWSLDNEPTAPCSTETVTGHGDSWRDSAPKWVLAPDAVVIDFRGNKAAYNVGLLPMMNARVPRGSCEKFTLSGDLQHCSINWDDHMRFGCGSLDYVHPYDLAEMWKLNGVSVMDLSEFLAQEGLRPLTS